jgi:hypothetical protein
MMFDGYYLEIAGPDRQAEILIVAPTEFPESYRPHGRPARSFVRNEPSIGEPHCSPTRQEGMICRFAENCPVKCRPHNETLHI